MFGKNTEALQLNNLLSAMSASKELMERAHGLKLLGLTELEATDLLTEYHIPYQVFYDEQAYKTEELPSVQKLLVVEGRIIGTKMSS